MPSSGLWSASMSSRRVRPTRPKRRTTWTDRPTVLARLPVDDRDYSAGSGCLSCCVRPAAAAAEEAPAAPLVELAHRGRPREELSHDFTFLMRSSVTNASREKKRRYRFLWTRAHARSAHAGGAQGGGVQWACAWGWGRSARQSQQTVAQADRRRAAASGKHPKRSSNASGWPRHPRPAETQRPRR